jgi:hypothetical protein
MTVKNITKTCLFPLLFLALGCLFGCEYIIGGIDEDEKGEITPPADGDTAVIAHIAGDWLSVYEVGYREFITFDSSSGEIIITCLQKIGDFWVETLLAGVWQTENQTLYIKNEGDNEFQLIVLYEISGDTLTINLPNGAMRHVKSDVAAFRGTLDEIRAVDYTLVDTEWVLLPDRDDTLGFAYNYPFHIFYGNRHYFDEPYHNISWYADTGNSRLVLLGLDLVCGHSYCGVHPPSLFELSYDTVSNSGERRLILRTVNLDDGTPGPVREWALDYNRWDSQAMLKTKPDVSQIRNFGEFLKLKIK